MKFGNFRTFSAALITALAAVSPAMAAENMISADRTLVVQLAIFLAGLFLLNRLVFRPLLGVLDRRRELTEGARLDAEEMNRKAESVISEYGSRIAEARQQANEARNELRQQGQRESSKMLLSAQEAAQEELEAARSVLRAEVADIKAGLSGEAESLAAEIAGRVLGKRAQG